VAKDLVFAAYCESKPVRNLEELGTFQSKEYPGTIQSSNCPHEVGGVLEAQNLPPKQKFLDVQKMKTEQVKSDGSFYEE
jgi:hypothetical protein